MPPSRVFLPHEATIFHFLVLTLSLQPPRRPKVGRLSTPQDTGEHKNTARILSSYSEALWASVADWPGRGSAFALALETRWTIGENGKKVLRRLLFLFVFFF